MISCWNFYFGVTGGYWRPSHTLGSIATVNGAYGDWCWQPIGCHAEVITAPDAQTCFANKNVAVLGDSNSMHVANALSGELVNFREYVFHIHYCTGSCLVVWLCSCLVFSVKHPVLAQLR